MVSLWHRCVAASLVGTVGVLGTLSLGDRAIAQTNAEDAPAETSADPADTVPETEDTATDDSLKGEIETAGDEPRFSCQLQNGEYTVMYTPLSQPGAMYAWATPEDMGSAWPAERRCDEISRRLESYRPDGLLELQTGRENGYNTVCVTTEAVASCRIVFTVPSGQDPVLTRDRVFDNLILADQGQSTQGVSTFVEGGNILDGLGDALGLPGGGNRSTRSGNINLQPFLDTADGGTGAQLDQNSGRQLDPNNF